MKLKALLLAVMCTFAQAQEVQETNNIVNMMNWQGVEYPDPSIFNLCCSGGPAPAINTNTNTIRFSWGYSTATQKWQINDLLPGSGIKISGFKYSWLIDNSGENSGSISATVGFTANNGKLLEQYNYNYGLNNGFTLYSGTETFTSPYSISSLGQAYLSFNGSDSRFWAGYYGPRVRDASLSLLYTGKLDPAPAPQPAPTPITTVTTTTTVTPTDTLITEIVTVIPSTTAVAEPTTTTTTLISSPVVSSPVATASPVASRTGTPAGAVNMILKNNATQQAALQSSNLSTSIQQSQPSSQDTSSSLDTSSDAVSLGLGTFNIAARQMSESMSSMDAANPTSTRNLLNMMTTKTVDVDQQEREDRAARNTATSSSSAQSVGADLGTGVGLAALVVEPNGYSAYSMQIITQIPFYEPREVYRGQRVIDNDRVRRGLSGRSDRMHHEMTEQQYGR